MPYALLMTSRVEKELRQFSSHIRTPLVTETLKLAEQPHLGEQLKGRFKAFRSLHINIRNVQYRVVYEIIENLQEIHIHALGSRENFYAKLERMKLKPIKAA